MITPITSTLKHPEENTKPQPKYSDDNCVPVIIYELTVPLTTPGSAGDHAKQHKPSPKSITITIQKSKPFNIPFLRYRPNQSDFEASQSTTRRHFLTRDAIHSNSIIVSEQFYQ